MKIEIFFPFYWIDKSQKRVFFFLTSLISSFFLNISRFKNVYDFYAEHSKILYIGVFVNQFLGGYTTARVWICFSSYSFRNKLGFVGQIKF